MRSDFSPATAAAEMFAMDIGLKFHSASSRRWSKDEGQCEGCAID